MAHTEPISNPFCPDAAFGFWIQSEALRYQSRLHVDLGRRSRYVGRRGSLQSAQPSSAEFGQFEWQTAPARVAGETVGCSAFCTAVAVDRSRWWRFHLESDARRFAFLAFDERCAAAKA